MTSSNRSRLTWMFVPFAAIAAFVLLTGADRIDGKQARELVKNGAVLLDVRTPAEYAAGHIDGAKLIPVQELATRLDEVGPKDTPVVVYCRSGRRSATAADMLEKAGFKQVHDLGGIGNW